MKKCDICNYDHVVISKKVENYTYKGISYPVCIEVTYCEHCREDYITFAQYKKNYKAIEKQKKKLEKSIMILNEVYSVKANETVNNYVIKPQEATSNYSDEAISNLTKIIESIVIGINTDNKGLGHYLSRNQKTNETWESAICYH
jgi:hypothetical protein